MPQEQKRLTVLLDAATRRRLDEVCGARKTNASAVLRSLIEQFVKNGPGAMSAHGIPVAAPAAAGPVSDRLTILVDGRLKSAFERACAAQDLTVSQVVRRLIRSWLQSQA